MICREGTGHENTGPGSGWTTIGGGKMRFLSVGEQAVWAVNPADEVFVRVGLSPTDTKGKEWTKIDGAMKVRTHKRKVYACLFFKTSVQYRTHFNMIFNQLRYIGHRNFFPPITPGGGGGTDRRVLGGGQDRHRVATAGRQELQPHRVQVAVRHWEALAHQRRPGRGLGGFP